MILSGSKHSVTVFDMNAHKPASCDVKVCPESGELTHCLYALTPDEHYALTPDEHYALTPDEH